MKLKFVIFLTCAFFILPHLNSTQVTTNLPINKVILWGHKLHSHTHSYIHWAFFRAFEHLGFQTYWFDNKDDVKDFDFSGSLFITEGQVDRKMPIRNDCFYILHNCNNEKYQDVFENGHCIQLQVYTHDCLAKGVTKLEDYIYFNLEEQIIYMPWATDLLPDEIEENKANIPTVKENEIVYIGTIWDQEFGNIDQITAFKNAAEQNNISFAQHKRCCSMEANIRYVKNAYMAPAIQGPWQVRKGYIPCRIFKNISYGAFGITNSETVYNLFQQKIIYNPDCSALFFDAQKALSSLTCENLYELMDFVKEKHTYVNRIQHLLNFIEMAEQFKSKRSYA